MANGYKTGGRQIGSLNKDNADVRAMVLKALNHVGGERYLARQAEENPTAFMGLVAKILPTTVANTDGSPIAMHLLAAVAISAQLLEQQQSPPTINAETAQPAGNLLDAPLPTE